ncbi:MAG: hypothetical protein EOP83_09825 [Verrucomicrobiaceae bacterium]|nr:MAG: hypothetical protein EOP83_09825 [Verrucomicrobiaceae bacterium]
MIEPLPPVPLDPHNTAEEIERLEFHIECLEGILRDNGLTHLIPEPPLSRSEASDLFMQADLPWLSPEAMQGAPEVHGILVAGIVPSPLLEAARRRLEALPEGFTDWVHEMPPLPEGTPEIIGPTLDDDGEVGC